MYFSRYNILSSRLEDGGYAILNGLTGAVDVIGGEFAALIRSVGREDFDPALLASVGETAEELCDRGYVTALPPERETEAAAELARKIDAEDRSESGEAACSLLLIPNYNCNYRCVYCFERDNPYMKKHRGAVLSDEQMNAFFRFTETHPTQKSITLYGGEPLSRGNRELVKEVLRKGIAHGFRFNAITNGHDLDAYLPCLGRGKIELLQITLDGPQKIHDARRVSLDGSSSFERICENLTQALEAEGLSVLLRINLDRKNISSVGELIGCLYERGILPNEKVSLVGGLVSGAGEDSLTYDEAEEALENVYAAYPELRDSFLDFAVFVRELLNASLSLGIPVVRRISACPAPEKMLIFAPDWKIYPCSDYVGREECSVGSYSEDGTVVWQKSERERWNRAKLTFQPECLACPYAFFCAGGCYKHVYQGVYREQGRCETCRKHFPALLARTVDAFLKK